MKKTLKLCAMCLSVSLLMGVTAMAEEENKFTDVNENDYFYEAVNWGVKEGITYGVAENLFAPEGEVTRAQVVTFLWRMAGQPTPNTDETFSDVEVGSWYETAVKWAVENEITEGTGDGMFSPQTVCDRAMCISLLYRLMNSPLDGIDPTAPSVISEDASMEDMTMEDFGNALVVEMVKSLHENNIIEDVEEETYYDLPVIWACLNGIITEDNTDITEERILFRPTDPCVRKEMISFLYQTKKVQDFMNAPEVYEIGPIHLPIPKEYFELLYYEMYGITEYEDEDEYEDEYEDEDEVVMIVSERASKEAAEAMGEVDLDGIGELFRIIRVSEKRLHTLLCGDMSGMRVFAKDDNDKYFIICYPTDVRLMRETNDEMTEAMDQWSELNSWARDTLPNSIIAHSEGLSPVAFTNTLLDMYLARIAYAKDVKYELSTTEFGPLDSDKINCTEYVEYLIGTNFEMVEDAEAPDGEYVVLNFPDEDVRYDFFVADKDLVREVRGDYVTFYRCVYPNTTSNTDIMQEWYDEIAKAAGKK